jgi:hypothetical protein
VARPDAKGGALQDDLSTLSADALLVAVHARVGGGIDIQTFGSATDATTVEVRWRRDYGGLGTSDERLVIKSGPRALSEALLQVLRYEDEADQRDADEALDDLPL